MKKKNKKSSATANPTNRKRIEERIDRRFLPSTTTPSALLYALLVIGGLSIGLGFYAQFLRDQYTELDPAPWAFWPLSGGGLLVAIAVWFSSNGDAALRVGAPGVAEERGGVRRIPWHSLRAIRFDDKKGGSLVVEGTDEAGQEFSFGFSIRAHRDAAARLLTEARERVAEVIHVSKEIQDQVGEANPSAGLRIKDPLQVVGKRCAASDKIISFEPDARVCPQCERVYLKRHVPKACACGFDLSELRDGVPPKELEASA